MVISRSTKYISTYFAYMLHEFLISKNIYINISSIRMITIFESDNIIIVCIGEEDEQQTLVRFK